MDDWNTRLVFADWLEECGDPRAEGYRALVAIGRRALPCQMTSDEPGKPGSINFIFGRSRLGIENLQHAYELCFIPPDWFKLLVGALYQATKVSNWKHHNTRRDAEDAAALAFARLPPRRRAKLLQPAE